MKNRLNKIEVIRLDPSFTPYQCQAFIQQWNIANPEKFNDNTFMPLFSPFIDSCDLIKSVDVKKEPDLLKVIMKVTPDNWPHKQEVADITHFVTSLKDDYDSLEVQIIFEVTWK